MEGQYLANKYNIGSHMKKEKSLVDTVSSLPIDRPSQIFLGGPQSTHMNIADKELDETASVVMARGLQVFVHSQYIINLSAVNNKETNSWNTDLLRKNLRYSAKAGFKGVVVHVGKSTTQNIAIALETMRESINTSLLDATDACPLLLETPAGQGSELLTDKKHFIDFVKSFRDKRLGVCIDTCHVFACGHDPIEYIKMFDNDLVKLVHFNDSKESCGSCKDRHAFIGTGHIGIKIMS
jgi:deoxyribonuclease-4